MLVFFFYWFYPFLFQGYHGLVHIRVEDDPAVVARRSVLETRCRREGLRRSVDILWGDTGDPSLSTDDEVDFIGLCQLFGVPPV